MHKSKIVTLTFTWRSSRGMEWINTFQVKEKEIKLIEDRANYFQWKAKEEKRHGK